jgi:hypothetical protein
MQFGYTELVMPIFFNLLDIYSLPFSSNWEQINDRQRAAANTWYNQWRLRWCAYVCIFVHAFKTLSHHLRY